MYLNIFIYHSYYYYYLLIVDYDPVGPVTVNVFPVLDVITFDYVTTTSFIKYHNIYILF